jgi:hypothetical protein
MRTASTHESFSQETLYTEFAVCQLQIEAWFVAAGQGRLPFELQRQRTRRPAARVHKSAAPMFRQILEWGRSAFSLAQATARAELTKAIEDEEVKGKEKDC